MRLWDLTDFDLAPNADAIPGGPIDDAAKKDAAAEAKKEKKVRTSSNMFNHLNIEHFNIEHNHHLKTHTAPPYTYHPTHFSTCIHYTTIDLTLLSSEELSFFLHLR